ncbi:CPBP family intramembrane glutamic endopeptidase [Nocardiopsis sp. CC223A]|uniref:CPBP family intramembrane glutamic endopeptidase n=1 Tax=Nocardiopsis sp. CC223A TaxID=3044051 RepID=UPI00278BFB55|nr:CPBP family intramembrane glutamic endopeptidase [Nocardiopsis sp. CC223A]
MSTTAPVRTSAVFLTGALLCFVAPPLAVGMLAPTPPPPSALVLLALVELALAGALVLWWLRRNGLGREALGLTTRSWARDALLGAATVPPRLLLEVGVLIPAAGGALNPGVQEVLSMASAGVAALAATFVLGVVGGGIAEELYFRGFLLGVVPRFFARRRTALYAAAAVSVVLFAVLHLPTSAPDVIAIVLAGSVYTALFLYTGRLTAPVIAHALWNASVMVAVLAVYG